MPTPPRLRRLDSGRGPRAGPGPHLCTRGLPRATGPPRPFDIKQRSMGRAATPPTGGTRGPLRPRFRPAAATAAPRAARHLTPFPPASAAWRRTRQGQPPKNPREAEYECRRRANAGEVLDPLRVHVRRRQETIEGASAAAGHDKNGSLLGFATTDEIGSVMDVTKRRKTKTARAEKESGTRSQRIRRRRARRWNSGNGRGGREEEEATEAEGPQQRGEQGEAGWGHVNVELISPPGG